MGKRKNKNKSARKRRTAVPNQERGLTPADIGADIDHAILALRGRRSTVLARKLNLDAVQTDPLMQRRIAAAHEAYVRELLDGGHVSSACDHARSFAQREPELYPLWALSLQVRLGLVDDLEHALQDLDWQQRLRDELIDPADLLDCPVPAIATDARLICDAWQAADSGQTKTARRLLIAVGRRSLLVDWRLFVQAVAAASEGCGEDVEASLKRIKPDTPAAALATLLRAALRQDAAVLADTDLRGNVTPTTGEIVKQAKALSDLLNQKGRQIPAVCRSLKSLLISLLGAGRLAAANLVLVATYNARPDDRILATAEQAGVHKGYLLICSMPKVPQHERDELFQILLHNRCWTDHERALLRLVQAKNLYQTIEHDASEIGLDAFDEDYFEDEYEDLQRYCREVAALWPTLGDVYKIWHWAEQNGTTHAAARAAVRAFPQDPFAWERLVRRLAVLAKFKDAEKALASLAALPGTRENCIMLEAEIAYYKAFDGFKRRIPFSNLNALVDAYDGHHLCAEVSLAVMLWLRAKGSKQRREFGKALVDRGHPWLVAVCANHLDGVSVSKLPQGIKRALVNDPVAVADDFLRWIALSPEIATLCFPRDDLAFLIDPVLDAFAHPQVSDQVAYDGLYYLLLGRSDDDTFEMLDEHMPQLIAITDRLICSGDSPTSTAVAALAFRAMVCQSVMGKRISDEEDSLPSQLLQAARQLASNSKTRFVVREVESRAQLSQHFTISSMTTEAAMAIWQEQKTIHTEADFMNQIHDRMQRSDSPLKPGYRSTYDAISRIIDSMCGFDPDDFDSDDFDSDEVERDWEEDHETVEPVKSIDLNKCYPNSEMEFERLIDVITTIKGKDVEGRLIRKIEDARISDTAKARLFDRLARRVENGGLPF